MAGKEVILGKLGPIYRYRNILCMPAQKLLASHEGIYFKGGPLWPDWEDEPLVRGYVNKGKPLDTKPDVMEPKELIEEPVAWGGGIHQQYGHFVADVCVPRIFPVLAEFPDITFAFIIQPNLDLKPWMKEIF